MTAPTITEPTTWLEELIKDEIPCDTNALGPWREPDAEHGPARWLITAQPCVHAGHTVGSYPICNECANHVRAYLASNPIGYCRHCGATVHARCAIDLKEL